MVKSMLLGTGVFSQVAFLAVHVEVINEDGDRSASPATCRLAVLLHPGQSKPGRSGDALLLIGCGRCSSFLLSGLGTNLIPEFRDRVSIT